MKKYLVLIGAVLLVFALSSPSVAQFKSWGHLEVQTLYIVRPDFNQGNLSFGGSATKTTASGVIAPATGYTATNTTQVSPGNDLTWRKVAERFRFFLQYGDPKTIRAVIGFEADSTNWGESSWTTTEAGSDPNPTGRMGVFNDDQNQLEIKWAFLEMVIPHTPLTLTLGMQGWNVGGRLFLARDMPGATLAVNFAPHLIRLSWLRERDVDELKANTSDSYMIDYQFKQKLFDIFAYFMYRNGMATAADSVAVASRFEDKPWWAGVGASFRPGNFEFSGSFHYVGGKRDFVVNTPTRVDQDYESWQGELMAQYQIGPGMFVRAEGFYSEGNDANKTDKIKRFTIYPGSEQQWSFGNGRSVFFWMNGDVGFYEGKVLDYTGVWYGRANFEYSPTAWLMLNFNYLYIGDNSKGTPGAGKVVNSPLGARQDSDKNKVGQEVNVIAKLKIYDNVTWGVGFGYFFPGDVYDVPGRDAEDGWALDSRLMYTF